MKGTAKRRSKEALQLYVELSHIDPKVWRRILISPSITPYELHAILQVTMGWMHSHLYMFRHGSFIISDETDDEDWVDPKNFKDAKKTKVESVLQGVGDLLTYEYDFGDSWVHTIKVEEIIPLDKSSYSLPRCTAGENAAPPEDCGGFHGFENLKKALADPSHEEHQSYLRWLDDYYPYYNPYEFSLLQVNRILRLDAIRYLDTIGELIE